MAEEKTMSSKYGIKDRIDIIKRLEGIIQHHNKMKGSYFFTPPSSANSRRQYEENNSDNFRFIANDHLIDVTQNVSCSCRNIYYNMSVTIDDNKENKLLDYLKKY